jgi:hypothetical protein
MPGMSSHEQDDPGANTAMFRAYVDHPDDAPAAPATNKGLVIALVVAAVVLALLAVVLVA